MVPEILTLSCLDGVIYISYVGPLSNATTLSVTYPDGGVVTFSAPSLPGSIPILTDGIYTFVFGIDLGDGFQYITKDINVQCQGEDGCDNIAWIYDCVIELNKRYEAVECVNAKLAAIEKIKLDRVMQLFQLSRYYCECGLDNIDEYIIEIQSIANCNNCSPVIIPEETYGCTSPSASNYNPNATIDDGSCNYDVYGCTDPTAGNYNSFATIDDGSCTYSQNCVDVTVNGVVKSETNVPDDNFETFLEDNAMGNGLHNDDTVCTANIYLQTLLYCPYPNLIDDLTGIEDFISLEQLNCYYNNLTSLDLSTNTALTHVWCGVQPLTSLNVTQCTALEYLSCRDTLLGTNGGILDVTQNTALRYLGCANSLLTSLDVTQNTDLDYLFCEDNQLTSLDVTNNDGLVYLNFDNNNISSIDISGMNILYQMYCRNTTLSTLDISNTIVTAANHSIHILACSGSSNLIEIDFGSVSPLNPEWYINSQTTAPGPIILDARNCHTNLVIKVGTGDVPGTTGGTGTGGLQTRVEYATDIWTIANNSISAGTTFTT